MTNTALTIGAPGAIGPVLARRLAGAAEMIGHNRGVNPVAIIGEGRDRATVIDPLRKR
ncbi:hypothetical protein [Rhodanobacter ginsengiterrae]|uniref:hypothetical protein n=1 Tax=Rhodanobacter ginsengiterrae TaxID=2008451 RepID=UPI003CF7D7C1